MGKTSRFRCSREGVSFRERGKKMNGVRFQRMRRQGGREGFEPLLSVRHWVGRTPVFSS